MDFARAFVYMFEDRDWITKVLIGSLVALASVLILPAPILGGYTVAVARNVMRGDETLPDWRDLLRYWVDGLAVLAAVVVYTLPFWLLPVLLVVPAALAGGLGSQEIADALGMATMAVSCLFTAAGLVVLLLISPILVVEYARSGEFSALFRVGHILRQVRDCLGPIFMALLVSVLVAILVSVVGTVLGLIPCVGWLLSLPLGFYPSLVTGHIYGQVGRTCPATA